MQDLIEYIIKVSKGEACSDDDEFNVFDFSGGNYDDAFELGSRDGEILFARYLIERFKL